MPKKKGKSLQIGQDFTINESANALKPIRRVKKSQISEIVTEPSWDQIADDDFDIVEELDENGTKSLVYKKKRGRIKSESGLEDNPGKEYPEIVWYLISYYIKPEDVGRFACINHATHSMTKREAFWRNLYRRHCGKHPNLPARLKIENSYTTYGLRQRVIRGLYHTYPVFINKIIGDMSQDSLPHRLVKRRCVNMWYSKNPGYWSVYFKLKKIGPRNEIPEKTTNIDFLEELSRIDANPDQDTQVLQVTCHSFHEVPPLMGMTLSSVSVILAQGFRHHRLHLGFSSSHYNISKHTQPECSVVIDTVIKILVYDWWHPNYPHFDNKVPSRLRDDESLPMLKTDFFNMPL